MVRAFWPTDDGAPAVRWTHSSKVANNCSLAELLTHALPHHGSHGPGARAHITRSFRVRPRLNRASRAQRSGLEALRTNCIADKLLQTSLSMLHRSLPTTRTFHLSTSTLTPRRAVAVPPTPFLSRTRTTARTLTPAQPRLMIRTRGRTRWPLLRMSRRCHSPTTQAGSLRLRRRCPCRTVSCAATWPTSWWPSLAYIERS